MRDRLESFATVLVSAPKRSHALRVRQCMIFQVLLLLKGFVAAGERTAEGALVAL